MKRFLSLLLVVLAVIATFVTIGLLFKTLGLLILLGVFLTFAFLYLLFLLALEIELRHFSRLLQDGRFELIVKRSAALLRFSCSADDRADLKRFSTLAQLALGAEKTCDDLGLEAQKIHRRRSLILALRLEQVVALKNSDIDAYERTAAYLDENAVAIPADLQADLRLTRHLLQMRHHRFNLVEDDELNCDVSADEGLPLLLKDYYRYAHDLSALCRGKTPELELEVPLFRRMLEEDFRLFNSDL